MAVGGAGATSGSGRPPGFFKRHRALSVGVALVLVLVLVLTGIVMLAMQLGGPANAGAGTTAATPPPAAQRRYESDLYHFQVSLGPNLQTDELNAGCRGVRFQPSLEQVTSPAGAFARLMVCYLGPGPVNDVQALQQRLKQRVDEIGPSRWSSADPGLPEAMLLGREQVMAIDEYVQGKEKATGIDGKWFEAVTVYENRVYGIEAFALRKDWDKYWPEFNSVLGSLQFQQGVIFAAP